MQTYAVTRPISAVNEAVLAVLHLFHFMSNNHVWSLHVFFFHVRFFPATCPFMYSLYLRMCINVHILSHCLFMCLLSSLCIATIQCSRALLKVLCFFTGLGSFSFMFTSHTFGFFFFRNHCSSKGCIQVFTLLNNLVRSGWTSADMKGQLYRLSTEDATNNIYDKLSYNAVFDHVVALMSVSSLTSSNIQRRQIFCFLNCKWIWFVIEYISNHVQGQWHPYSVNI